MKRLLGESGVVHILPLFLIITAIGIISYLLIVSTAPFTGGIFNIINPKSASHAASNCQFLSSSGATAAFCDDLSGGPSAGGRAGDLDDSKWSVGRYVGDAGTTDYLSFPPTPVSGCKSGVTSVNPDNDILVCDNASGHQGQMLTALSAQYYGILSLRPRQMFDFTGRTGIISFNVDAVTEGGLAWWPSIYVTDEPYSFANNGVQVTGGLPKNGFGINFDGRNDCSNTAKDAMGGSMNVFTYTNYFETNTSLTGGQCFTTAHGKLNHIEIRLSQTSVEIWASDASTDGINYPNFRKVGSAVINLPFSKGYVHFQTAERAPEKYATQFNISPGYANYYWSNLGFDGPVSTKDTGYEVMDALTSNGAGKLNIAYGLLTNPYSTVSCCGQQTVGPFTLTNVNLTGVTSAKLTYSLTPTYFDTNSSVTTIVPHYRINGGSWKNPNPIPDFVAEEACSGCPGPNGGSTALFSFPVAVSDLVQGNNTIELSVDGTWNGIPPMLANVDLLTFGAQSSTPPSSTPTPNSTSSSATPAPTSIPTTPPSGSCGLSNPAFCDTFDQPAGIGNRSGDLNGTVWGVSRIIGLTNLGPNTLNAAPAVNLVGCNGTNSVYPPHDVIICNGQVREATNDNPSGQFEAGGVTSLAMYPKQPFDFAGRTGKITFDVGNDTHGSHAAWPEFWMSDKPVPDPFSHFESWISYPQHGFGIRFDGYVDGNGNGNPCPEGGGYGYVGVGSAIIIRNWIGDDYDNAGHSIQIKGFDCVKQPTQMGQLNHYEIDVSQNQIDIYGTDAGTTAPLKHLAVIPNANLSFTRGLIWLEDVHYNADKADPDNLALSQRQHTFVWDNAGFDGPFTYRDLSFDALDNTVINPDGTMNLGKIAGAGQTVSWNVLNMPASPTATAVRAMFNFYNNDSPTYLDVGINGHMHHVLWPYPTTQGYTWRTFETTIPITDLVPGTNVVTVSGDQTLITSNVNIVLVDAGATGPTPTPSSLCQGADLDGNGSVNIFDYNILLTNFGKSGSGISGDIDGNGKIDIFDYNILISNFGKTAC